MASADIIVEYEDTYANYGKWQLGTWERQYAPNRFWHIIHHASQTEMQRPITMARQRNVGWLYVTDKTLPNPFDQLPSYWPQEIALLR